jgi:hypothetical protein
MRMKAGPIPAFFVVWRHPDSGVRVHTFAVAARPVPLAHHPTSTLLVRLLPRVGRTDALVDLATSEMFYEQGNMAAMWDPLVAAANDKNASPLDRFWAMDAIAYWGMRRPSVSKPATSPPTKTSNACSPVSAP